MSSSKLVGLRLFIEGVEVPIVGVDVSAGIMQPATANITVPATEKLHELKPRSLVHVFYFDNSKTLGAMRPDLEDFAGAGFTKSPDNPYTWHLLFTGEYMALRYVKSASSRHAILSCSDFTSYWDLVKMYWGGGSTENVGIGPNRNYQQAIFAGGVVATVGKSKVDTTGKLLKILDTRPSTVPTLQGVLGGCVHLLEAMSGVYDDAAHRKFHGVSDFMSQTELRLHLTKTLGVCAKDTSSHELTKMFEFRNYVQQMSQYLKYTASYGQLVKMLLDRTFHTQAPVLCPPYIPKGQKASFLKLVSVKSVVPKLFKDINKQVDDAGNLIATAVEERHKETIGRTSQDTWQQKPVMEEAAASATSSGTAPRSTNVDYTHPPDVDGQRVWVKKWYPQVEKPSKFTELTAQVNAIEPTGEVAKKFKVALLQKIRDTEIAASVTDAQLMNNNTEAEGRGDKKKYPGHTEDNYDIVVDALGAAKKRTFGGGQYKTVSGEMALNDRLVMTLITPTIWMCPPPKCNVIFPDGHTSIDFNRNFMAETTRLWLYGISSMGAQLFGQSYFAPNSDVLNLGMRQTDVAKAALNSTSFLLEHEKFTGIIPSIQGMGNMAALKAINKQTEKDGGEVALASFRTKNPALARAANAKFLEERFRSRSASVMGPFNPNLVVGLPALVLDPALADGSFQSATGTHYLGYITQLDHSIQQNSVRTNFSMGFVRKHDEGLELYGKDVKGKVSIKKKETHMGQKVLTKDTIWAEVHGWVKHTNKVKVTNAKTKKVEIQTKTTITPVIGMAGVTSKTGKHVTRGMQLQNISGSVDYGSYQGGWDDVALAANNPGGDWVAGLKPGEHNSGTFKNSYTVVPKKYPGRADTFPDKSVSEVLNGSIDVFATNNRYHAKKNWMSPKALAAVEVEAYEAGGDIGKTTENDFSFSFEQIARPPWLSKVYLNQNIGKDFYGPLLGCDSLVDNVMILSGHKIGTTLSTGATTASPSLLAGAADKSPEAANQMNLTIKGMLTDPTVGVHDTVVVTSSDGTITEVDADVLGGAPIEVATDELARAYIDLVRQDYDTLAFVDEYTRRAFATMVDMFGFRTSSLDIPGSTVVIGTKNLVLDQTRDDTGLYQIEDGEAKEGFHSHAFGPYSNMDRLPNESLETAGGGVKRTLNPSADPRQERYTAALEYLDSLGADATRV